MLTREQKKKEAIKRMRMLRIMEQPIKEFKEDDKLNLSENGILFWLDDAQQAYVNKFEQKYDAVVYHVIHDYTNICELLSMLYVSKYDEEWNLDKQDILDGKAIAYVENLSRPDCSEIGRIGIKPFIGGVKRIW